MKFHNPNSTSIIPKRCILLKWWLNRKWWIFHLIWLLQWWFNLTKWWTNLLWYLLNYVDLLLNISIRTAFRCQINPRIMLLINNPNNSRCNNNHLIKLRKRNLQINSYHLYLFLNRLCKMLKQLNMCLTRWTINFLNTKWSTGLILSM